MTISACRFLVGDAMERIICCYETATFDHYDLFHFQPKCFGPGGLHSDNSTSS